MIVLDTSIIIDHSRKESGKIILLSLMHLAGMHNLSISFEGGYIVGGQSPLQGTHQVRMTIGRSMGIEPTSTGPQPGALPLSYDRHLNRACISKLFHRWQQCTIGFGINKSMHLQLSGQSKGFLTLRSQVRFLPGAHGVLQYHLIFGIQEIA